MRTDRPSRILFIALVALSVFLARPFAAAATEPPPFLVIVHPSSPHAVLSRRFVGDAFLKKTTRWPNGSVIRPVDLGGESPVRERFSQEILKRSTAEVKTYWQQIIFSGRDVPPPELADDEAILKFVGEHPNAIGYVSGRARLGDVRAVTIE